MSRIGLKPITIPAGVTIEVTEDGALGGQSVRVVGPKGELTQPLRKGVTVVVADGLATLARENDEKQTKSYHGLYRSLISNMVTGVAEGYRKDLQIIGIGYRAEMQGNKVVMSLGYSHKINFEAPAGIQITVENQTEVSITGVDRQLVGEVAAKLRSFRKPEPYKGKGVRYKGEIVRKKSAKKA